MKHIHSDMKWILPAMAKPGTQGVFLQAVLAIPGTSHDHSQLKYAPGQLPVIGHLPELTWPTPGAHPVPGKDGRQDQQAGNPDTGQPAYGGRAYPPECGGPYPD